jgi:hypothetical protein
MMIERESKKNCAGRPTRTLACLVVALSWLAQAQAEEILAYWQPDQSEALVFDSDPVVGVPLISDLSIENLIQANAGGFQNPDRWPVLVNAPRSTTRFLEFSVRPENDRLIKLRRIVYPSESYGDSNLALHLQSSLDAFFADLGSAFSAGPGFRSRKLGFDLSDLPPFYNELVTFRLYPDRIGEESDYLDLLGNDGFGLRLLGEIAIQTYFAGSQFYSFSQERVGTVVELPDGADRQIEFSFIDDDNMRVENQASGGASVYCLTGEKDFFAVSVFDASLVTEQSPACLEVTRSDLPSDVSIWKLPDGRLFRFQIVDLSTVPGSVSGRLQAGPIRPDRISADRFEGKNVE